MSYSNQALSTSFFLSKKYGATYCLFMKQLLIFSLFSSGWKQEFIHIVWQWHWFSVDTVPLEPQTIIQVTLKEWLSHPVDGKKGLKSPWRTWNVRSPQSNCCQLYLTVLLKTPLSGSSWYIEPATSFHNQFVFQEMFYCPDIKVFKVRVSKPLKCFIFQRERCFYTF